MHSLIVVTAGLLLLGIMLMVARAAGRDQKGAVAAACRYFMLLWFVLAAVNMAVGVLQAGYPVSAEAPIFLGVFGLPAAIACWVRRRWGGQRSGPSNIAA